MASLSCLSVKTAQAAPSITFTRSVQQHLALSQLPIQAQYLAQVQLHKQVIAQNDRTSPKAAPQQDSDRPRSRWFRLPDWLTRPFRDRPQPSPNNPADTSNSPFRPLGKGAPSSTGVGGSRDDLRCPGDAGPVQILLPGQQVGLTLSGYPSLFLALDSTQARKVMIAFEHLESGYFELAQYPLTVRDGLAAFQLNASAPELETGRQYRWFLSVICGDRPSPNDPLFSGVIQRRAITREVQEDLQQRSLTAQAQWYTEQGYWYDLLELLDQNPELLLSQQP